MDSLQLRLKQDMELLETFQDRIKLQTNLQMQRERKQLDEKLAQKTTQVEQKVNI